MVLVVVTAIHLALTVQPDRWAAAERSAAVFADDTAPPAERWQSDHPGAAGGQLPPTSPTPWRADVTHWHALHVTWPRWWSTGRRVSADFHVAHWAQPLRLESGANRWIATSVTW